MKKIVLLSVIVVCFIATAINMRMNLYSSYSYLALNNIEALADTEGVTGGDYVSFTFNGQDWHGNPNGKDNWFPKYDTCRESGKNGHQVHCTKGGGNCWNGTSCIYD